MKAKIKLTEYQMFTASDSGISNPTADSGYQTELVKEMHRVCHVAGNTVELDAQGFEDLGEWANDLSGAVAQEPNPSGARSLAKLSERCYAQARALR
jgi:hypothetical protein